MPPSLLHVECRIAVAGDLPAIARIYNQGIEDRIATLESDPKSEDDVAGWLFAEPRERYDVIVATASGATAGWAALRPYSHRCAYAGVADVSIYVERAARAKGVGGQLLAALEDRACAHGFHKLVLFALAHNLPGLALYGKRGFREVGVFKEHGTIDGRFADVVVMEKILSG